MYLKTNIFMQFILCVCSPCPIAVKRLPAYNLYSNTQIIMYNIFFVCDKTFKMYVIYMY